MRKPVDQKKLQPPILYLDCLVSIRIAPKIMEENSTLEKCLFSGS